MKPPLSCPRVSASPRPRVPSAGAILIGFMLACTRTVETPMVPVDAAYEKEIRAWQQKRADSLQREDGWLSLIGLHWLKEGRNTFGSDSSNDVVIDSTSFPARAGALARKGNQVEMQLQPGVDATKDGAPAGSMALESDENGSPSIIQIGSVRFNVIKRAGDRLGLRVKDAQAPSRLGFKGLDYFPVDPSWRVHARFEPYNPPKKIPIPNIIGTVDEMDSPGALVFSHEGREYRIDPLLEEGSDELFLIVKDQTAPRETYGAGRYLYIPVPGPENTVAIDFNKAYNPPCAFTPYATCPLPPPQNVLPIAIRAGEKNYAH